MSHVACLRLPAADDAEPVVPSQLFWALIGTRLSRRVPESASCPASRPNRLSHPTMANFFDIKARKAAAAATASGEGSSKSTGPKVDNRLQPWVEK